MTPAPAHDTLPALLASPARAGVRPLPPGTAANLKAAALQLGFHTAEIDLAACADKAEVLRAFETAFALPDWFGHNWDALSDCLADLSWLQRPGYLLLAQGGSGLRTRSPETLDTLLDILRDASRGWAQDAVPFWVFLDLGNPPVEGKVQAR
ncbi:hypothetical protein dqs_3379 [Azoarcus olearius]|uniref:barstar family protein n=1 Tax=Azoarcus sp. (strain BH72) TaxID=418699 RepID=UPI0008061458|nr:barstar family protein [Azoarcus olearius]ANQ86400.1 hypothetical protein dqs_3379 [Azoarcus olearius]